MLKLNKTREVWYPVTLSLLMEGDNSGMAEFEIEVKYRLPKRKELLAHTAAAQAVALDVSLGKGDLVDVFDKDEQAEWVYAHIADWRGMKDDDDKPIPCNLTTMRAVCDAYPAIFLALEKGLYSAASDAPIKN